MTNPVLDAIPLTGSGPRSKVAALFEQRLPLAVFTIQEIKDNDFSAHTRLYVSATDLLYRKDVDETGANDDFTIIVDAVGTRFVLDDSDLSARLGAGNFQRGHIYGLTVANDGSDPANDLTVAAGEAVSEQSPGRLMKLASAMTKRLDAAWAAGNGEGGLDTGAVANGTYHVHLIGSSDGTETDILLSASVDSPTMPEGYTHSRRIMSVVRAAGAIRQFTQLGDEVLFMDPAVAWDVNDPGADPVLVALSLPTGIKVRAKLSCRLADLSPSGTVSVLFTSPDQNAVAPSAALLNVQTAVGSQYASTGAEVRTDTSGRIRYELSSSGAAIYFTGSLFGYIDTRGKDG